MKRFLIMISVLTLCLTFLLVIPAMAVEPTVTTSRTGPDSVDVGLVQSWTITITICPDDVVNLEDVVVQGGIGADLVITAVNTVVTYPMAKKTEQSVGDVTLIKKGGKMGATIVKWDIGTLLVSNGCLTLVLTVETGLNPKDKQEFTSAEIGHELDGGFSAIYTYDGIEYETIETEPLTVDVEED